MYYCEICKKIISAKTRQHKVPVEFRKKVYFFSCWGWEIVKEIKMCPDCFKYFVAPKPPQTQRKVVNKKKKGVKKIVTRKKYDRNKDTQEHKPLNIKKLNKTLNIRGRE